MRAIPPLPITDAMLTSSSVAEPAPGETAWNAGTAYTVGQQAIRASTHRVYQRLVAGTTATAPETDLANWLDVGPTQRWAMFDTLRNSATTATGTLTVAVTPGRRVSSLALMNMHGTTVTITVTVAGDVVYTFSQNLSRRITLSWSDYFFREFKVIPNLAKFDIPPFTAGVVTVTITPLDGEAKCGALVIGQSYYMGEVQYSASSEALNFSTVTRDSFGNANLVPRKTLPGAKQTILAPLALTDSLRELRDLGNATPMVWSGLDDRLDEPFFEALLLLGVYKEFTISADSYSFAKVDLALEEI